MELVWDELESKATYTHLWEPSEEYCLSFVQRMSRGCSADAMMSAMTH